MYEKMQKKINDCYILAAASLPLFLQCSLSLPIRIVARGEVCCRNFLVEFYLAALFRSRER